MQIYNLRESIRFEHIVIRNVTNYQDEVFAFDPQT